mgnify:CR=1 FL=1
MSMLYLANEVLHTGTRKCPDWVQHFVTHLPGCLAKLPKGSPVHQKAQRLAQIWGEREILGTGVKGVYQALGMAGPSAPPAAGGPSRSPSKGPKSPSKGRQQGAAAGADEQQYFLSAALAAGHPDNVHLNTFDEAHYRGMSEDEQGVFCWCLRTDLSDLQSQAQSEDEKAEIASRGDRHALFRWKRRNIRADGVCRA